MHLLAFAESIQLFPDGTLFIHIFLILLMIWVLNRTFFKPINRVVASREKFRGGRNVEAEEILSSVSEKQQKYDAEIREARTEGHSLIETERAGAVAARQEKVAAAKAAAGSALETGKREVEQQSAAARATIDAEADQLADRISSSILKI
jgi:F-type H+-transporting ATPase subunit b